MDARKATPPPRFEVKAPAGAPNVVIVLIDDLGFGAARTFGGPIPTPTFDRLAQGGCATTTSTPLRCARRPGRHSRRAATITP
jgi:arylsulfatase